MKLIVIYIFRINNAVYWMNLTFASSLFPGTEAGNRKPNPFEALEALIAERWLSRSTVIRYFTPDVLQLLNYSVYLGLKGQKKTEADRKRRRVNASLVLLVAIASLLGFYHNGFFWRSLFFDVNYMVAIVVSLLVSLRMKTPHLATLVVAAIFVSFALERAITSGGVLVHQAEDSFLFVVPGLIILMIAILGVSDLFRAWIARLGIFKMLERWRILPTAVVALVSALGLGSLVQPD